MHYLIIEHMETADRVYIENIKNMDFVVKRDEHRELIGEIILVGNIGDFDKFRINNRDKLYEWTRNSYNCYLHSLLVERVIDTDSDENTVYSITGLEEAFIVNFGEEYLKEGNTFNLLLRQKKKTNIGTLNITKGELDQLSSGDYESKSGFEKLTLEKLNNVLRYLPADAGDGN